MTKHNDQENTMTEQDQQPQDDQNPLQDAPEAPEADAGTTQPTEAQEQPQNGTDDEQEQEDGRPNREAAKWRRKLRETEEQQAVLTTELEQARADLDRTRWALLDAQRPGGVTSEAMKALGHSTKEFFSEAGEIDLDAYRAAARAATEVLGIRQNYVPTEGQPTTGPAGRSFANALAGHNG